MFPFTVHGKLKAFTLQEVIVVMLLTGIIIGFFFYALRFIQRDLQRLFHQGNYQHEAALFVKTFHQDMQLTHTIQTIGNSVYLFQEKRVMQYTSGDSSISKMTHRTFPFVTLEQAEMDSSVYHSNQVIQYLISGSFVEQSHPDYFCVHWYLGTKEKIRDTVLVCVPRGSNTHFTSDSILNFKRNPNGFRLE